MRMAAASIALVVMVAMASAQSDSPFAALEQQRRDQEEATSAPGASATEATETASAPTTGASDAATSTQATRPAKIRPGQLPPGTVRDPFWPVGWTPPVIVEDPKEEAKPKPNLVEWEEATKQLQISGVFKQGKRHLAILKGVGVVEEGDIISVNHKDLTYRWRVSSISPAGIMPKKLDVSATR